MNLEIGIYKHYKGNLYEVLMCVRHSENEKWMVVYKALKDNNLWVRDYDMFNENVEINGVLLKRFEKQN